MVQENKKKCKIAKKLRNGMKPVISLGAFQMLKTGMYERLENHPNRTRALCIPMAIQSVFSYPLLATAMLIEGITLSFFNLVGLIARHRNATLKDLAISLTLVGLTPTLIAISILFGAVVGTVTLVGCLFVPKLFVPFSHRFHQKLLSE